MSAHDGEVVSLSLTDPSQFATIFDRHVDAVRRFVVRRLGSSRSDDVISEVFRVAFERRDVFDTHVESGLPWLYGIASNLVRRECRSRTRHAAALERVGGRREDMGDPYLDLVARVDARSELAGLRRAVLSLTDDEREMLLLVAWEQLSPTEAAAVLSIPPATARTRLHRARQQIRRQLEQERGEAKEPVTDA